MPMHLPSRRTISPYYQEKYGLNDVVDIEVLEIGTQTITITFEAANRETRRGLWLGVNGTMTIGNAESSQFELWEDTAPREVVIHCRPNDELISFYNRYAGGAFGHPVSLGMHSGMRPEPIPRGFRYRCQDAPDRGAKFDSLVFRMEFENPDAVRPLEGDFDPFGR